MAPETTEQPRAGAGPAEGRTWVRSAVPILIRIVIDVGAVLIALLCAHWIDNLGVAAGVLPPAHPNRPSTTFLSSLLAGITIVVFWRYGLYRPKTSVLNLWEMSRTVKGVGVAAAFFLAALFILRVPGLSRVVVVLSLIATLVLVVTARRTAAFILQHGPSWIVRDRRTLIVGCGEMGRLLMKKIIDAPHSDRNVVGFVDDRLPVGHEIKCFADQTTAEVVSRLVLGRIGQLEGLLSQFEIDEILVDESAVSTAAMDHILDVAERAGVEFGIVPEFGDLRADHLYLEDVSAVPVLRPHVEPDRMGYRIGKRVLDVIGALVLLLAVLPLLVLAALANLILSPGPVLFAQERVGLRGKPFRIYKFRTMARDTNPYAYGPSSDQDPRVTPVGRILRTSGFDELPQLFNVLRGDMSLVGPRPEMPFIVNSYTPLERRRLSVKPGITGVWQLSPDRRAQIHENIEYDFFYIHHQTLFLDLLIMVETIFATVGMIVQRIRHRFGEPKDVKGSRPAGPPDRPRHRPDDPGRATKEPSLGGTPSTSS